MSVNRAPRSFVVAAGGRAGSVVAFGGPPGGGGGGGGPEPPKPGMGGGGGGGGGGPGILGWMIRAIVSNNRYIAPVTVVSMGLRALYNQILMISASSRIGCLLTSP